MHPNLANYYRPQIQGLAAALTNPETEAEAKQLMRRLIDRMMIHPTVERGHFNIDLEGRLLPSLTPTSPWPNKLCDEGLVVVAAEGFEPPTKGL